MQVLNLDKLRPEDKAVTINGREYIIPGKAPVSVWLDIVKSQQELSEGKIEAAEKLVRAMWLMFRARQPELSFDEFSGLISLDDCFALAQHMFGDADSKNAEAAAIPTQK